MNFDELFFINLQSILNSLPGIAFIKDRESKYLMVNDQFIEFRNFHSFDDIVGKTDYDFYPKRKADKIVAEDRNVIDNDRKFTTEHYSPALQKYFQIVKTPLRDANGKVAGLLGTSFDVTDLMLAKKALEKSQSKYKLLAENVRDVIWVRDMNLKIVYITPSVEKMKGWTREESMNLPLEKLMTPESVNESLKILAYELQRDGMEGVDPSRMILLTSEDYRKDGSKFWAESTILPLRDKEGKITQLIGVTRDINERRNLENQLFLSQKMEAVGRLAGGMAHDFNNILSIVLSYSEFLLDELPSESPYRADIEEIMKAGKRAVELAKRLLSISRRDIVKPKVINPAKVIRGFKNMLRRSAGPGIQISLKAEGNGKNIRIDQTQFEQIIFNLVFNACDAMPDGGRLDINISNAAPLCDRDLESFPWLCSGEYICVSISDTGHGMPEEIMSHLFEPFFTTKTKAKGTGLGLSTVYAIVKQAGGAITAASKPGAGSTFKFCLPATDEPEDKDEVEEPRKISLSDKKSTILLVEDEEAIRSICRKTLQAGGYRVYDAGSGSEALNILDSINAKIDLLITDVLLPGMSGKELADIFSAKVPCAKIIFMSGYTDDVLIPLADKNKSTLFLKKPFTAQTLLLKVYEAVSDKLGINGKV